MTGIVVIFSIFYIFYLLAGGAIFVLIDGVTPVHRKQLYNNTDILTHPTRFKEMEKILLENNFTEEEIKEAIIDFVPKNPYGFFVYPLFHENFFWTFVNSFLFCLQISATGGYGGIVPHTTFQQVFCLAFAVLGIPLSTLCMKIMSHCYFQGRQQTVWILNENKLNLGDNTLVGNILFFTGWSTVIYILPAIVFLFTESWSFLEGIYYVVTALPTSGLGDYVLAQHWEPDIYLFIYKLLTLAWMLHGLSYCIFITDAAAREVAKYALFEIDYDFDLDTYVIQRVRISPEVLDVHFLLMKTEPTTELPPLGILQHDHLSVTKFLEDTYSDFIVTSDKLIDTIKSKLYLFKNLPKV